MIKLQDFAKQQGVTDRAIQKHLKTYEAELEGLFERKGPNGTWLTEEACDILRSKMRQQPIAFFEEDPRVEQFEERVRELETQIYEKEKMLTLAHQQVQSAQDQVARLQELSAKVPLLEADNEIVRRRAEQAEADRKSAEERARVSDQERISAESVLEQTRRESAKQIADLKNELSLEVEHAASEEQRRLAVERENEEMRNAGLMKRIFGWR